MIYELDSNMAMLDLHLTPPLQKAFLQSTMPGVAALAVILYAQCDSYAAKYDI
jgi:hypothetical protein